MNILDKIISKKQVEIREAEQRTSLQELEQYPLFQRSCYSLKDFILNEQKTGIIAEYKRASPSKGIINDRVPIEEVVRGYEEAGASAISVLTDADFFQGSLEDLSRARQTVQLPLLRKDFVISRYQIAEAKAYGADIILLIAAALSPEQVRELASYAKTLGLNVLLEVHNLAELQGNLLDEVDAIGVNNRNLKDFSVSIEHSLSLVDHIPGRYLKVSESGISDPSIIRELRQAGFDAFLIGENFMKTSNPAEAIQRFVNELDRLA